MKITKRQLRRIIREERARLLREDSFARDMNRFRRSGSPAAELREYAPELVGKLYAVINEIEDYIVMEHDHLELGPGSDRDNAADAIKTIVDEWLDGIRG